MLTIDENQRQGRISALVEEVMNTMMALEKEREKELNLEQQKELREVGKLKLGEARANIWILSFLHEVEQESSSSFLAHHLYLHRKLRSWTKR